MRKQYKIYVKDKKICDMVLDHAYSLGYVCSYPIDSNNICFILLHKDNVIGFVGARGFLTFKNNYDEHEELTPEEFYWLDTDDVYYDNETEEETMDLRVFDIEPFDKVLVCNTKNTSWNIDFSESVGWISFDTLSSRTIRIIIKYRPELRKYIGTTDNIPGCFDIREKDKTWREKSNIY